MRITRTACVLPIVALAACTSNPFLVAYRGDRLAPTASAAVVAEPPAADAAKELGTSTFATSDGRPGDAEAIAAARAVGADLVTWSKQQLSRDQWVETDPVYDRRASGRGQFGTYVALPGSRERWNYDARFWRSVSAVPASPAAQPGPGAAPGATPVQPAPDPAPATARR